MKEFTKKHLINLFLQSVMFYPKHADNLVCKRLNSFVWLEKQSDFKKEHFGVTQQKQEQGYFFSRNGKVEIQYPALFIWEQNSTTENRFSRPRKECSMFQVTTMDREIKDCKNCNECQRRATHDIQCDARELQSNALDYLLDVVCVTVDGQTEHTWIGRTVLDQMVSNNQITGYTEDTESTNSFKRKLRANNPTTQGSNYQNITKNDLSGVWEQLKFCFSSCPPCEFKWEDKGYGTKILNCC